MSRDRHPGRQWRSLLEDPAHLAEAYPSLAGMIGHPASRRRVLQIMAASLALAGCKDGMPEAHLIPAVQAPPEVVPGLPNYYSTANVVSGDAIGIVVTHQMGRPIKIEGNPNHPASLGATDPFAQAALLDFYDPDRASALLQKRQPSDWPSFLVALTDMRGRLAASHGDGLRILTGNVTSPTLGRLLDGLLSAYPGAQWHQWEPAGRDAARAGAIAAYGQPLDLLPYPDRADVVLALDSDLISSAPGHVRHARHLMSRRNPTRATMNRIYAAEPTPTLIGSVADHRFVASPSDLQAATAALAGGVLRGEGVPSGAPPWVAPVLADLQAHHGRALIHAGPGLPTEAHALVLAMNEALGGRGHTFDVIDPIAHRPVVFAADIATLIADMEAGRVDTLLVVDSNPVFTAPGFADALQKVRFSVVSNVSLDETASAATFFVPLTHYFETWGDVLAFDGTATIMQPQALPLFGGTSPPELLALFTAPATQNALDAVRETWKDRLGAPDAWRDALAQGVAPDTAHAPVAVALRPEAALASLKPLPALAPQELRLVTRPDPHLWDGRFANNPWMQELPRPLTKVVWDNPLMVSPATAKRMDLVNGAQVEISIGGAAARMPVWIVPGQADDVVVALFGYGRQVVGDVGSGTGFDVYPLRKFEAAAVTLQKTGRQLPLATTDHHDVLEASPEDIVRHGTVADFRKKPDFLKGDEHGPMLYRNPPTEAVAWGMSVDLNACIGCNACVVACMAENNVPVVGKTAVMHEREMHWLRIDRYYEGPAEAPEAFFQPMLCMHCEEAPCEVVCPFGATVHDQEGLNVMIYNRCAGTRFCSNNCPYKVRRFNYGAYTEEEHRVPEARNPDVTVRGRGVMEKCTFCLQRIAKARIAHDRDGAREQAVTACQAACPTRVFTFGDLNDHESEVTKRKASPLDYVLLPEQNTRPRLTYEALIRNPNPDVSA
ncbi:MAG: 4Fe-4S dicluster domain-containing protein [Rhodopila sp.]